MRHATCIASLLALGCEFVIPSGRFACDTTADCPPGQSCSAGVCRAGVNPATDASVDGSVPDAGTSDGGVDAGADPDGGTPCPAETVCGTSRLRHITATAEIAVDEDLSGYRIQAYIPDSSRPSGFRIVEGEGTSAGTFTIAGVPDDPAVYYLRFLAPGASASSFMITDRRVVDLDRYVGGRPDAATVSLAQPVQLELTNMQPWREGDLLVTEVFNTSTEHWSVETFLDSAPAVDDTALSAGYDWGCAGGCYSYRPDGRAALASAEDGDVIEIAHARRTNALDDAGRRQGVWTTLDVFETSSITMTSGEATTIEGAFVPVDQDIPVRVQLNRSMFDSGYDGHSSFSGAHVALFASPGVDRGVFVGPPLFDVLFEDWSRPGPLTSFVDIQYGDWEPSAWPRVLFLSYDRLRVIRLPGASPRFLPLGQRRFLPFATPLPDRPDVQPASNIRVSGVDVAGGGRVMHDGEAPVRVAWSGSATATYYAVSVQRVYSDGGRTANVGVATFSTTGTAVDIPAEVFSGGEHFFFRVTAFRDESGGFAAGHLRLDGYPYSRADNLTGLLRLGAACGNGSTEGTEACDETVETATCDIDCSAPLCGDGLRNSAAGEACDDGIIDTFGCDSDCTLVVCGDGWVNTNVEACDDGNTADDGNGCTSACRANNTCGDGALQDAVEQCDDGDTSDGGNGCSATCTRNDVCGDGWVQSLFEICDDGNTTDGDGCASDCQSG